MNPIQKADLKLAIESIRKTVNLFNRLADTLEESNGYLPPKLREEPSSVILRNSYQEIEDALAIVENELLKGTQMEKQNVTETDKDVIKSWYEQDIESVDAFIEKLNTEYNHDYGTICHAIAAVAVQAAKQMNKQSQGGITGFQAGAVMWEFVKHWMHLEGPMRLVQYDHMLYPQYFEKFDQVISPDIWKNLQTKAMENLIKAGNGDMVHENVVAHWKSIVNGVVPFGYVVQAASDDK